MVDVVYILAAFATIVVVLRSFRKVHKEEKAQEDALNQFREVHARVRKKRQKAATQEAKRELTTDEMRDRLGESVDADARKAAHSLKRFLDGPS